MSHLLIKRIHCNSSYLYLRVVGLVQVQEITFKSLSVN